MPTRLTAALALLLAGQAFAQEPRVPPIGDVDSPPRRYVCGRVAAPPRLDGRLDDACWQQAPWTADFVDIEGSVKPAPRLRTRAKMCWDATAFYFAFELEEPDVWATLRARDSVIFQDNDIELFLDPDGDTHAYYELEINAYGTEWDLFLRKPYRDTANAALHGWDIAGLRSAVHVDGTIDDPTDTDRGWTVEVAIPWPALAEAAGCAAPPAPGDVWRADFSRVEWRTEVVDGRTRKVIDPATGRPCPEDNWVWSPQGVVNMHCPETWGLVLFADGAPRWPADLDEELAARRALRHLYRAEHAAFAAKGAFASDLAELADLGAEPQDLGRYRWPPRVRCTDTGFEAVLPRADGAAMHLREDGRIWRAPR